jgi:hypothetical protein
VVQVEEGTDSVNEHWQDKLRRWWQDTRRARDVAWAGYIKGVFMGMGIYIGMAIIISAMQMVTHIHQALLH